MKVTKLLIVTLLSLCFFPAKAQWRLGAEVGIDLSSVNVITNHTQIGSHGGLTVDYAFKNRINLSTGVFHTMKGANTICADDLGYEMLVRLGYLEVPVMIGYRIPIASNIHLTPSIGTYFSWGVNGYGEFEKSTTSNTPNESMNLTEWSNPFESHYYNTAESERKLAYAFNRFDTGLRFGLNAEIGHVSMSFNYDLGLKSMWKGFMDAGLYHQLRNRNATLAIGYKFQL
ncbi:outer membrane beta-barrel protein [uncultured Parabacteroides sp.]|uniref:outer membrane beta-barrel protein n=1 Tax=uncultured Parabacteroides sp. TaxID=512312 RepID=UPI0025FE9AD2|nr:outer membrane beta-barrel protein [uncultured Parabacteroides sp.]